MNPKIISAIAFKLFGIYVVISGLIALPMVFGAFVAARNEPAGPEPGILWPIGIAALTLAVALIAFKILWRLGDGVLTDASELGPGGGVEARSFEKTLFVLLGIYFSLSAVVEFPALATTFWVRSQSPPGATAYDYAWLLSVVGQLLIGMSLVAKWDRWLLLVRNLGVR